MSRDDFMKREQMRVRDSLDAVVKGLQRTNPTIAWPLTQKVAPHKNDEQTQPSDVFIGDGRQVKRLFREKNRWSSESIALPARNYTSLSGIIFGKINPAKYLFMGYKNQHSPFGNTVGIDIINLVEPELKHIVVEVNSSLSNSGFQSPHLIRTGEGEYDFTLLAAHSELGIIKVPLDELIGVKELKISLSDQEYVLFLKQQDNANHLRLCAGQEGVYFANGREVYLLKNLIHAERIFELPADVSAMAAREKLYCGTTDGRIFQDTELFCDINNINFNIEEIFNGTYRERKGIFFNTYGNNHYEGVYFTDGSKKERVTSSVVEAVDFQVVKNSGYYITRGGAVAYHTDNKRREEIMHLTDDKKSLKHLCMLEELK